MSGSPSAIVVLAAAALLAGLLGCEEDLAGRSHFELPFSMYGVLSPDLDTQSVRVYALEDFPTLGSPTPLDVDFTSTDLTTGTVEVWRDSVVVEPNGQHEHLFWAPFRAEFGHRYRIEVRRRADGARSHADVRVPPLVTVRIVDPDTMPVRVVIAGAGIRVHKPEVAYTVQLAGDEEALVFSYWFSYQGKTEAVEQGWQMTINIGYERVWAQSWYNLDAGVRTGDRCQAIALREMRLLVLIGDTLWNPPGGVFDPNVLSHPTTMTNVENGFGFIGGGYRIVEHLRPSRKAVEDACFYYVW